MHPDFTPLDARLGDELDGYLVDADGDDPTQRYLSGFGAPDPFLTCYTPGGTHLLVSGLEYGRAQREADATTVSRLSAYDYRDRVEKVGRIAARAGVVADFLADRGVAGVAVPTRFPVVTADGLREEGIRVDVDGDDTVTRIRAVKSEHEVDHVRATQRANERAMATAEDLIAGAETADGVLHHDGDPLTSETVRRAIERALLEEGCALDDTIVACGADAADPHDRGSGPLRADESVVVDIFPRDKETRYHADMTRTFVRGDPDPTLRQWFEVVDEARRAALDAIEPGVTGADVHDAACDVIEDAGLPTLRSEPDAETGFIHGTGHGVGLAVHELPRVAPEGEELRAGNVITVEPGLYDPAVGGVRIEDLVVVTEDGHENLTDYPVELVV
jgi:Xaa-Pro aminopeptidase